MGKAEGRAKDAAMAANLAKSAYHGPEGVRRRKAQRLAAFLGQFRSSVSGSAAYRRRHG